MGRWCPWSAANGPRSRLLVIGQVERQPSADGPVPHTSALSYFSRLTDAATFEHLSVVETQRRGLDHAGQVAAVTDGAEWIPSRLQTHVPGAVRILDLPHAVEHLSAMANAIWGEGSAAGQAWVTAQTHNSNTLGVGRCWRKCGDKLRRTQRLPRLQSKGVSGETRSGPRLPDVCGRGVALSVVAWWKVRTNWWWKRAQRAWTHLGAGAGQSVVEFAECWVV